MGDFSRCLCTLLSLQSLLLLPVAAVRRNSSTPSAPAGPRIDVYVINLDSRPDRYGCIQAQLNRTGLGRFNKVVRHSALPAAEACPADLKWNPPWNTSEEANSLFCNNYRIWKEALAGDADYVVVLEDDALLRVGWYDRLLGLLRKGSCRPAIDFIVADPIQCGRARCERTFRRDFWTPPKPHLQDLGMRIPSCKEDVYMLTIPGSPVWWTTEMTIIRTGFLPTLIQKAEAEGGAAMDAWWQLFISLESRAFAWHGDIAHQASKGEVDDIQELVEEYQCPETIGRSDLPKELLARALRLKGAGRERKSAPLPHVSRPSQLTPAHKDHPYRGLFGGVFGGLFRGHHQKKPTGTPD